MVDWLQRAAARRPGHPAVVADGVTVTYAELLARARETEPPATIAHPPGLDFAVALHACLLRGVPANLSPPTPHDASGGVVVVHTSGTTGEPKPVALSAENILASALGTAALIGVHADDRWLVPLPLHHVGGLMVLLRSVIYATTAVIAPHDPDATLASMVPTQLVRGLDAGMPRLRAILLGGGPVAPELRRPGVLETYGMTETTSSAAIDGHPLPGVDIAIADDGEILVSGPIVAGGGTLRTGDLGRIENGRLAVTGRKSDTIITGGENVAPAEVEHVLTAHPAVTDAAVVGRPDPEWGEALVALVVGDVEPDELRAFCRERLPPYKVPKRVERVAGLPRTPSGKLLRRDL
jgi:O-succinylbenzoic acid--CoA ligase